MRELVIQPLPGIGDMVWHLPHIHAIAAANPAGQVDVLTKPRSLADRLLAADPAVGRVLWLERTRGALHAPGDLLKLVRTLRAGHYDRVWILHASSRYALAARLAGIPVRIGYGFGLQKHLLSHPVALPPARRRDHPIDKAGLLLHLSGIVMSETEPGLIVDRHLAEMAARENAQLPRPWYALGIGSSNPAKQWGAENFAALMRSLLARGGACLVFGGPAEADLAREIVRRSAAPEDRVRLLTGAPIDAAAALLSQCDVYVGNDTGMLNVAAAVGVRSLGIFGGSVPLRHTRLIECIEPPAGVDRGTAGVGLYEHGERGMAAIGVEQVLRQMDSGGVGHG